MLVKRIISIALLLYGTNLIADNRIDGMRPDAPELAAYGDYSVGVTTVDVTNADQIDILKVTDTEKPRADRTLTLEVFYPSKPADPTPLRAFIRDGETEVDLHGVSSRDAEPDTAAAPYPLVIISHGFPGNRFLMSHLAENLASKGYVVASIDHTDSTYRDKAAFGSTLVNRSLDQTFVLNEMQRLSDDSDTAIKGMVDTSSTALVGYSMGGYGAVITAGGGVTQAAVELSWGAPAGTLAVHLAGSDSHKALRDERIKSIIAIAPWGMERGFWDADGLSGINVPTMYVAGSADDVSGYEKGVRAMWEQSTGAPRHLLTFDHANHNAAAPYPAPAESMAMNETLGFAPFEHYADAVWDTNRMNNIMQHFATAFIARHSRGDESMDAYLDLVPNSNDAVWATEEDGTFKPEHNYWKGFQNRTAKGLQLEFKAAGE